MIDQKQADAAEDLEELAQSDAYEEWQKREGVPVIRDFVFEDLNALELGDWPHLVIMGGDGFSMLWRAGDERRKINWKKGGMVIVPWEDCFHQHFNSGSTPARYLALRGGGNARVPGAARADVSIEDGGWQVEYEDEDPSIHRQFEGELAEHGATCLMKAFVPSCTGERGPTFIDQRD